MNKIKLTIAILLIAVSTILVSNSYAEDRKWFVKGSAAVKYDPSLVTQWTFNPAIGFYLNDDFRISTEMALDEYTLDIEKYTLQLLPVNIKLDMIKNINNNIYVFTGIDFGLVIKKDPYKDDYKFLKIAGGSAGVGYRISNSLAIETMYGVANVISRRQTFYTLKGVIYAEFGLKYSF